MTPGGLLSIDAAVTPNEAAVLESAAATLAEALTAVSGATWSCAPTFYPNSAALLAAGERQRERRVARVSSLLEWLTPLETHWSEVARSIRSAHEALAVLDGPVMILTILRHVEAGADPALAERTRIRIRRLNLLATELSREYGAFVIDLDRVLADRGAQRLQTDYQLGGKLVRNVAGKTVAQCIIANTLDELVAVEVQTKAHDLIASQLPVGDLPLGATSSHLWSVGQGVRKQTVAMTEMARANGLSWLLRQVLRGHIRPTEASKKVLQKVRERGMRLSAQRVGGALKRLARIRS